jgi:hypothetical protein
VKCRFAERHTMNSAIDKIALFYEIDKDTYVLIAMFCAAAAHFVRSRIQNAAFLLFLYPLFCLVAFTVYAGALHNELFSPKRHAEWIIFSISAAAIGTSVGILFVSLIRLLQDKFVVASHIRRTIKRDAEQETKGYPVSHM